jgi:hypothetical protein
MALLRLLNRAAFICNICFLVALLLLHYKGLIREELTSMIIVMGIFLSILLNFIVIIWFFTLLIFKKPLDRIFRRLVYFNTGFLVIQLILLIKSNS